MKLTKEELNNYFYGISEHLHALQKTALALYAELEKAENERASAEAAFENKCDLLAKAESELAGLQDAVAWYFEIRYTPYPETLPLKKGGFGWFRTSLQDFHSRTEYIATKKHAEQQLRELIGGENV